MQFTGAWNISFSMIRAWFNQLTEPYDKLYLYIVRAKFTIACTIVNNIWSRAWSQ